MRLKATEPLAHHPSQHLVRFRVRVSARVRVRVRVRVASVSESSEISKKARVSGSG